MKDKNDKGNIDLHIELVNKIDKILKEHEEIENAEKRDDSSLHDQVSVLARPLHIEDWKPLNKRVMLTEYISSGFRDEGVKIQPTPEVDTMSIPAMQHHGSGSIPAFRFIDRLEGKFSSHNSREDWMRIAILPETNNDLIDRIIGSADITIKKRVSFNPLRHIDGRHTWQDASMMNTEALPQQIPMDKIPTMMREQDHGTVEAKKDKTTTITPIDRKPARTKQPRETEGTVSKTRRQTPRHEGGDTQASGDTKTRIDKKELKKLKKLEKKKEKELKKKQKQGKSLFSSLFSKKKGQEEIPLIDDNVKNINVSEDTPILDEDVRRLLVITDNLLAKLPDNVIEDFARSEDYILYEKVMSKYKIK